jgi:hypothetical protein
MLHEVSFPEYKMIESCFIRDMKKPRNSVQNKNVLRLLNCYLLPYLFINQKNVYTEKKRSNDLSDTHILYLCLNNKHLVSVNEIHHDYSYLFNEFMCKFGFFLHEWATSAKKVQFIQERVEYNVFLFDETLEGSKSL